MVACPFLNEHSWWHLFLSNDVTANLQVQGVLHVFHMSDDVQREFEMMSIRFCIFSICSSENIGYLPDEQQTVPSLESLQQDGQRIFLAVSPIRIISVLSLSLILRLVISLN